MCFISYSFVYFVVCKASWRWERGRKKFKIGNACTVYGSFGSQKGEMTYSIFTTRLHFLIVLTSKAQSIERRSNWPNFVFLYFNFFTGALAGEKVDFRQEKVVHCHRISSETIFTELPVNFSSVGFRRTCDWKIITALLFNLKNYRHIGTIRMMRDCKNKTKVAFNLFPMNLASNPQHKDKILLVTKASSVSYRNLLTSRT